MIETQLPLGERYVPNDVLLDTEKQQIMMITSRFGSTREIFTILSGVSFLVLFFFVVVVVEAVAGFSAASVLFTLFTSRESSPFPSPPFFAAILINRPLCLLLPAQVNGSFRHRLTVDHIR